MSDVNNIPTGCNELSVLHFPMHQLKLDMWCTIILVCVKWF